MSESNVEQDRFQFRLWHAFYLVTLLAVVFSIGTSLFIFAAVWIALCAVAAVYPKKSERVLVFLITGGFAAMMVVCFGTSMNLEDRVDDSRRRNCLFNMRQLMLSMLNYETEFGHLPAGQFGVAEGTPPHSWRVAILPYIDQQSLYDQYDFDQPWDSPANRKLIGQMPDAFRCPCLDCADGLTSYKLVAGPGTLFDGQAASLSRVTDGPGSTIAIVEDHLDPVEWTRPSDLKIDEAVELMERSSPQQLPHFRESTFRKTYQPGNFAALDGNAYFGPVGEYPSQLRKYFQIADGAVVKLRSSGGGEMAVYRFGPLLALGLFVILMLYPFGWVIRGDSPLAGIGEDSGQE